MGRGVSGVGLGHLTDCNRLPQLCLVIAVIDARQDLTLLHMLAFFDGFFYDLSQDFGPDRDVLVAGPKVFPSPPEDSPPGGRALPPPDPFHRRWAAQRTDRPPKTGPARHRHTHQPKA